ncbi:MAG: NAD(P)/FAD-dependent oxidoreductase, partial [Alistipes sp.]|nr:NAD(P)/FAD-dependent oxidoreductase [Alistipes sp.]
MNKYDVIIIGGGLGGLACGAILAREGLNVCVLEQNRVIGGCLQSFRRRGKLLDTGIHYIGSMDQGHVLNQYFKYFG